ncbi:hypothetical protein [Klebsiella pneumoniae]|uniref:hypothetical protein n=1 Tax=Klebsiella pneumoniae TaxID=573 RepID=UPI002550981D|nr:hypothetical protein [Klebsiella pneumoniae]
MSMGIEMLTGIFLFVCLIAFLLIAAHVSRKNRQDMEKKLSEFKSRRDEVRREMRSRL